MPLELHPLEIPDVLLIRHDVFGDSRGSLMEGFKCSAFQDAEIVSEPFAQLNRVHSVGAVLRGLHYQHPPFAQGKLIHVVRGEIFDVAVDLRRGSPTYAAWVGHRLSHRHPHSIYIPPGFAHGYCTLGDETDVVYLMSAEYAPAHQSGIVWNDAQLDVAWPIRNPTVSDRDARLPTLREADIRFVYKGYDAARAPTERERR